MGLVTFAETKVTRRSRATPQKIKTTPYPCLPQFQLKGSVPFSRKKAQQSIIPVEQIASRIYIIRGQKVMLDRDLAELYGVSTGRLNEQVKRNIIRFPKDFMFSLKKRNGKLEVANCDIQSIPKNESQKSTVGLYGTGSSHAFKCIT